MQYQKSSDNILANSPKRIRMEKNRGTHFSSLQETKEIEQPGLVGVEPEQEDGGPWSFQQR